MSIARKKYIKNLILIGAVLIAFVIGVVAWFIAQKSVEANELAMMSVSSVNIEISSDGKNFAKDISFTGDMNLEEVSGLATRDFVTNELSLYKPLKDNFTGQPLTTADGKWKLSADKVTSGLQYAEMSVYVRSAENTTVFLDKNSAVTPLVTDIVENPDKKSEFGDFSVDYLAGAARVAIVEEKNYTRTTDSGKIEYYTAEELKYLWIPNSKYMLSQSADGKYSFTEEGTAEGTYKYYDGKAVKTLGGTQGFGTEANAKIGSLTRQDDGTYLAHYYIRVFIEGTDREAQSVFMGGKFNTKIVIKGLPGGSED